MYEGSGELHVLRVCLHWKFLVPSHTSSRLYVSSKAGVICFSGALASTTLMRCVLIISISRILACIASEFRVRKGMGRATCVSSGDGTADPGGVVSLDVGVA